MRTVDIPTSSGDEEPYFYVEDAVGLVSEAQMDTLEFHLWGSRVDTLEQPDMMVFDLDPDKGLGLEQVRRGVRDLKGILDELGLKSFLKTSGGKGYHVVLPFQPAASWDAFHDFARRIAQVMAEKWPDRYTSNVRLAKRTGKVFIDWMRNGRGATSIAPYSLRARSGARVGLLLREAPAGVVLMLEALGGLLGLLAEAAVGVAALYEQLGIIHVERAALGLHVGADGAAHVRALVVRQPALAHGLVYDVHGALDEAALVGILYSQYKLAAGAARDEIGVERGAQVADVHVARRARREAGTYLALGYARLHGFKPAFILHLSSLRTIIPRKTSLSYFIIYPLSIL